MIKLKNITKNTEHTLVPTIFPDKSSQIWHLPAEVLDGRGDDFSITWFYESEAEVMHLLQLNDLLRHTGNKIVKLFIPYFPYARQDKGVNNESTFACYSFLRILNVFFPVETKIETFDIHNSKVAENNQIDNRSAVKYIVKSLMDSKADLICFPDKSASKRYPELADFIVASKIRNQATGVIEGHEILQHDHDLTGKTILVCDDILDGAATFISVSKLLKAAGAEHIDVYISHGIFSKGVTLPMELGGIRRFYTTNSYLPSQKNMTKDVTVYKLEE